MPAASAVIVCELIGGVSHTPRGPVEPLYGYVYELSAATAEAGLPRS